jgi:hypothetical protein
VVVAVVAQIHQVLLVAMVVKAVQEQLSSHTLAHKNGQAEL